MATNNPSELYATMATAAATLIGLLFVAISLVASRPKTEQVQTGIEIQASGCMFCFIDVLLVTLFGLADSDNIGITTFALGVIGLIYGLASLRSLQLVKISWRSSYSQLGFIATIMLLFILQLHTGLDIMLNHVKSIRALTDFSTLPIIILLVGVARTWQLVGSRDTGVVSSLMTLINANKSSGKRHKH
jgi:hypothetical protein